MSTQDIRRLRQEFHSLSPKDRSEWLHNYVKAGTKTPKV